MPESTDTREHFLAALINQTNASPYHLNSATARDTCHKFSNAAMELGITVSTCPYSYQAVSLYKRDENQYCPFKKIDDAGYSCYFLGHATPCEPRKDQTIVVRPVGQLG
jgi:hypothetical protein